jgi:hypothetical protein
MPRVEYTLSFQNYLEMTKSRREKPNYRTALICALLGFSLIAAGYLCLRIWPESRNILGGLMLATGLLATGLALILAVSAKPKSSRPDRATLRSEYERFHADKRAIDFDENGWRLFWYEGEDVRPWSCLRAVYDEETLLILSTETTHYWLPKDALEREGQLANLKTLAERALTNRELLFTVPMRPSALVFVAANFFHNWRRQFRERLLGYSAVTLAVYWIGFSGWDSSTSRSLWFLFLVPALLVFGDCLNYLRLFYFTKWLKSAQEARIMSDCIAYKTDTVRWIVSYRRLCEFRETPGAFLLYFEPHDFHLIPKKGFSDDQVLQFRKLISAHA